MKLDAGVQIWFAWQEGDQNAVALKVRELIGSGYKARLPSASWQFYTEQSESIIIKTIMLSNEWWLYFPLSWTDSAHYHFLRRGGPPQVEKAALSYRNYIIVTD